MSQTSPKHKVYCFKCIHFYITHDSKHPYGCASMAFKSRRIPSHEVMVNSGMQCQAFQKKEK